MSLSICIPDLIATGKIDGKRAQALQELYDKYLDNYRAHMGEAEAKARATQESLKYMETKSLERRRVKLQEAEKRQAIEANGRTKWRDHDSTKAPVPAAYAATLAGDSYGRASFGNVEMRYANRRNQAQQIIGKLLHKHRANALGEVRNPADFDNDIVPVLEGRPTSDVNVREFADSVAQVLEFLRQGLNAHGAHIDKMDGGYFPHRYDSLKMSLTPYETMRNDFLEDIDRDKMIDRDTGLRMSDEKLEQILDESYRNIASDGEAGNATGSGGKGKALYNRRSEQRILHFKPGGWSRINEKYGSGSAYDQLLWHIDDASMDMALMEILGPNPAATVEWMSGRIKNNAFKGNSLFDRLKVPAGERKLEALYAELTGQNRRAVNRKRALIGSTLRNWQVSTKLGASTISAITDTATTQLTRNFNGLQKQAAFGQMFSHLNPLDSTHREAVRRHLYIQQEFIGQAAGMGRMHMEDYFGGAIISPTLDAVKRGDVGMVQYASLKMDEKLQQAHEASRRMAELQLRGNLLNHWTTSQRGATLDEFWSNATFLRDKGFAETPEKWQRFLMRYGIGEEGWEQLRKTPLAAFGDTGVEIILPANIGNKALRDAFTEGVLTEMDYAVIAGGVRQRAAMSTFGRPGELFAYEIPKLAGQFLLFPITATWKHGARAMSMTSGTNKAIYFASFLGMMTLYGAVAEQLQNLRKGKDLRPMDNWDFWKKAMARGGGLGYIGEVFEHMTAEDGRGLDSLMNMPSLDTLGNVSNATVRPAYKAVTGEENTGFKRGVYELAKDEVPFANTWYLSLAYQLVIADTIGEWAEPGYMERRRKSQERRAKEEGTQYFAPSGQGLSGVRAPDLENALGDAE